MIVTNTETVAGYEITELLGLVQGNTVRAKNVGRDIMAGLKNLAGGELKGYTELLTASRQEALTENLLHPHPRAPAKAPWQTTRCYLPI